MLDELLRGLDPDHYLRQSEAIAPESCPAREALQEALLLLDHSSLRLEELFHCGHEIHCGLDESSPAVAVRFCHAVLCCLAECYEGADDPHRAAIDAIAQKINAASVNLDPGALNLRKLKRLRATLSVTCIPSNGTNLACKCAPLDERSN